MSHERAPGRDLSNPGPSGAPTLSAVRPVPRSLSGRRAVITGGNSGIGYWIAHDLAAAGCEVTILGRTAQLLRVAVDRITESVPDARIDWGRLDLASLTSVRQSADGLLAQDRPIHLLMNNAGVAAHRGATSDGFEIAFGVNHLGHFLLTTLLTERLEASGSARVVNTASMAHFAAKGVPFASLQRPARGPVGLGHYEVSKLCNVLHAQELARRHDPAEVTAISVHPGVVATRIWRRMPGPILATYQRVRPMLTPYEGSLSALVAASAPEIVGMSGAYLDADGQPLATNPRATPALAGELWRHSTEWTADFTGAG